MRDFLKQSIASIIGTIIGIVLLISMGTFGLIFLIIATANQENSSELENQSVLVFKTAINIVDNHPSLSTQEALEELLSDEDTTTISLRRLIDSIDQATEDNRIIAIYLDASQGDPDAGLATLKEVRQALARFRKAGKKIIAYNVNWTERSYYLASIADTIILNPFGAMELDGFASQTMFLSGALEKYGIGVQVLRVGKYKSAVEPLILKQMSPENKQQVQVLLNDLWKEWLVQVSQSRKINAQKLQNIVDNQGIVLAGIAKQQKLVDRLAYQDQVISDLKKLTNVTKDNKPFKQISLINYAKIAQRTINKKRDSDNKIAIVYASGEIVDGQGTLRQVGGDRFARTIRQLRNNDKVKAIVLRVNSPGGSAIASEIIQREIRLAKLKKPVIVSMGDLAASGGYWISTYGTRIFAEPNTITGSIGVFGILFNVEKLAKDQGITWDTVKTGRFADSQTISRPKNPQELQIIQKYVNQIYYQFLVKVAESRKIPIQKVANIAQGRVWSGQSAQKIGLVDQIGGLDDAIKYAVKITNLGEDWELMETPKQSRLDDTIFKGLSGDTKIKQKPNIITSEMQKFHQQLKILESFNDPRSTYTRLPFNFRVD